MQRFNEFPQDLQEVLFCQMAHLGAQTLGACIMVCHTWNRVFKKDEFWKRIFEEKKWLPPSPGQTYYSFHCNNRVEINCAKASPWSLTEENHALYKRATTYIESMKEQHQASEGLGRAIGDFSQTLAQPQFIDSLVQTCTSEKIQGYIDEFATIQVWLQDAKNRRLEKEKGAVDEVELLVQHLQPRLNLNEHRVLLVGLDGSGKTTLLYRLHLGEIVTTIPTIGFNVETLRYHGKAFTVWDVGGQDKIRPLWRHYTSNSAVVLYVVHPQDRVELAFEELEIVSRTFEDSSETPLLVIAVSHWDQIHDSQKPAILQTMKKESGKIMTKFPSLWSKCRIETYSATEEVPNNIMEALASQLNPIVDEDFNGFHQQMAKIRSEEKK